MNGSDRFITAPSIKCVIPFQIRIPLNAQETTLTVICLIGMKSALCLTRSKILAS